jgi:hypothetical protein
MPCPFPGMDPYLEHPGLWPDVHHGLIEALRDALAPVLRPRYRVAIEQRIYVANIESFFFLGRPNVSILGTKPPARLAAGTPIAVAVVEPVPVELPLPDRLREGYLEVRDVTTG